MVDIRNASYIILLGDVGAGKSTIYEKLTGEKGRSSSASQSFTRETSTFLVPDGSLIVADTPGSNALKEKVEHNIAIASAVNFRAVSKIFIVVKAEDRIDSVIDSVRKYSDRFLDFPMECVAVLVTHMDRVSWKTEEFLELINDEIGLDDIVYSSKESSSEQLLKDILSLCSKKFELTINDENFFKIFKIHNNHRKILKCTEDEVKRFETMNEEFKKIRKLFNDKDQVDLIFEFQAYMGEEIVRAQERISESNNFTFFGDKAANEAGHVANMVNQLRVILYDIRVEGLVYQAHHGVTELRKCPHCGHVWTKVEGCEGSTTCGNRPRAKEVRSAAFSKMGTFEFRWDNNKLNINKSGSKTAKEQGSKTDKRFAGCGKTITWTDMATVAVPSEFSNTVKICTDDVKLLHSDASGYAAYLKKGIEAAGKKLKLITSST